MTTKETAAATTTKQAAARQRAFAQLDATFRSGVTRPLRWRKAQLDAMARMLRQNATVIARAVRADLGKPAAETALMEIGLVLDGHDAMSLRGQTFQQGNQAGNVFSVQTTGGFVENV